MSTLSTYRGIVNKKLGTTSVNYHTQEARDLAINNAIEKFVGDYVPKELRKRATLTVASNITDFPSDILAEDNHAILKIWDDDTNKEYFYLEPNEYDGMEGKYYTLDYNVSAADTRILVADDDATSLEIRYIKEPTALSTSTDDSGLLSNSDDIIAGLATIDLLRNEGRYDEANTLEVAVRDDIMQWQSGYGFQPKRLKSVYERTGYLN